MHADDILEQVLHFIVLPRLPCQPGNQRSVVQELVVAIPGLSNCHRVTAACPNLANDPGEKRGSALSIFTGPILSRGLGLAELRKILMTSNTGTLISDFPDPIWA